MRKVNFKLDKLIATLCSTSYYGPGKVHFRPESPPPINGREVCEGSFQVIIIWAILWEFGVDILQLDRSVMKALGVYVERRREERGSEASRIEDSPSQRRPRVTIFNKGVGTCCGMITLFLLEALLAIVLFVCFGAGGIGMMYLIYLYPRPAAGVFLFLFLVALCLDPTPIYEFCDFMKAPSKHMK